MSTGVADGGPEDSGQGPPADAGEIPDAGEDAGAPDAGEPTPDAGPPFVTGFADEPCASDTFEHDAGVPDGTIIRGLCISLGRLEGVATVDGSPASAPVRLAFDAIGYAAEITSPVDGLGHYAALAMRAHYDRLVYEPTEIQNHAGGKDVGAIDLSSEDQTRNLAVKTWHIAGSAFFAGQGWEPPATGDDLRLYAEGIPNQSAWTRTVGGGYEVRLLEGDFGLRASVPFSALGDTELLQFPVLNWLTLNGDRTVDIDVLASEFFGTLTIDGSPFPDRVNGADYRLEYVPPNTSETIAATLHAGGTEAFSALVPRGLYDVYLSPAPARDASFPAQLFNKRLAAVVDLNQSKEQYFALQTHELEGSLSVDGVPVTPNANASWSLYAFARQTAADPYFIAMYEVPLTDSTFRLRAFPAEYSVMLWLDPTLHPELARGWHDVAPALQVFQDRPLPIDVATSQLTGTLLIDGAPASAIGIPVGTLLFQKDNRTFRHRVVTGEGTFNVRLPRGRYAVSFEINPEAYPDHASGLYRLPQLVDLEQDAHLDVRYDTVPVAGPLRVAGQPFPNTLPTGAEAGLSLRRRDGSSSFYKSLEGGRDWYFLRVPKGDYRLTFRIAGGALNGVAGGTAPLGNDLLIAR